MGDKFSQETTMPADAARPGSDAAAQTSADAMLPQAVQTPTRVQEWLGANREALDYWNRDIAANGLPLDRYR
jgi:post-segregation antitoxin (ccd killing protein)